MAQLVDDEKVDTTDNGTGTTTLGLLYAPNEQFTCADMADWDDPVTRYWITYCCTRGIDEIYFMHFLRNIQQGDEYTKIGPQSLIQFASFYGLPNAVDVLVTGEQISDITTEQVEGEFGESIKYTYDKSGTAYGKRTALSNNV